jgi:hypothetical protein
MKQSSQDDSGLKRLLTISWFYDFFQKRLLGAVTVPENGWLRMPGSQRVEMQL